MKQNGNEMLLKLQQGELDAVLVYRKLAELASSEEEKNVLLSIAADEGRHASIIREYSKEILKPCSKSSEEIEAAYKSLGKEKVFKMLINAEINGGPVYEKLGEEFPRLKEIAKDEIKHGNLLKGLIGKSNLN
ncbi:TPA: rubrerythrin [Clostridium perfringens]|uniref:ferritin family protein n=1 Tax=Clostridium perfringens TaxID=1502 RepID=UPI0013E342B6|nr:ferritin family protein [Clostridium perfringens]EJT6171477.1 rubrerythrin [Clostridium perfringens]EJT6542202.1 rubrerythrin [Clostridium perfringens]EJT6567210.1 rubrerythrin [Clostridium perfringens]ELC8425629.1 rubrerythrin [Clostridium perfringens]MBS5995268.1 rubrerythrin [Clostridium perfringens]